MLVQAFWIENPATGLAGILDEDAAFRQLSAAWSIKSNFQNTLGSQAKGGAPPTIQFASGQALLVIGGRSSIREAFANNPVAAWNLRAAPGEFLFADARRKRHGLGTFVTCAPALGFKMLTTPSVRSPQYLDKLGKLAGVISNTFTVLHLTSKAADPDGHSLAATQNGAQMAIGLANYLNSI
jgi:hypothetical protein